MSKSLKALTLTAVVAASAVVGVSARADARPAGESACPYKYVVSDGTSNNVVTYKGPRGKARQGSIRPNQTFVVFFGSDGGAPDHVAGRQRTDHGWVSFPRNYLRANGRCGPQQSLQDAAQLFQAANGALGQSIRDAGQSLRSATR